MDNVVILTSSDSDSDFSDESGGHSDREEVIYESEHFMNHVNKKDYEINRNKLFFPDIEEVDIMIESTDDTTINNYKYKLYNNASSTDTSSTGGLGEYKNVIGIQLVKACIGQRNDNQEHFTDICVPTIPYKACINNSDGNHIIARIHMNASANELKLYEPSSLFIKNNFFYPITLHELEIDLKYRNTNSTTTQQYDSDIHNFFIFRLTILKNLELLQ